MELIELLRDGGHFKLPGIRGEELVARAFMRGNVGKVNRMIEGGTQRWEVETRKILVIADLITENYDIASFLSSKGATE